MKFYKAVVIEKTAAQKGQAIANTKSPGEFQGMTKEEFIEATKYISCYTIEIIEF